MTALTGVVLLMTVSNAPAAPDAAELTRLLGWFLAGAGKPGAEVHERFWADDLIYTGSSGRRVGKADILRDVRSAPAPAAADPTTTYGSEDVRIQQYGDAALVAFRLVATTEGGGRREVARYLNTGTFLKRNGEWRAVGWQATRMPFVEEDARAGVEAAERAFRAGLQAADTTALAAWITGGFVWTRADGARLGRRELFDRVAGRKLGDPKAAPGEGATVLAGETAIRITPGYVGGPAGRETMTLVREGGGWRVAAIHSSRP
jgi:ketosteroid isomerase-like protein